VFGQEVPDFLSVDKYQLFTVTTSAVQAIDHRQQAIDHRQQAIDHKQQELERKVETLERQVQELQLQLQEERSEHQQTFHRILKRISNLEAK
jgi:peptidoglycan hydrolase CwlO-like protein